MRPLGLFVAVVFIAAAGATAPIRAQSSPGSFYEPPKGASGLKAPPFTMI